MDVTVTLKVGNGDRSCPISPQTSPLCLRIRASHSVPTLRVRQCFAAGTKYSKRQWAWFVALTARQHSTHSPIRSSSRLSTALRQARGARPPPLIGRLRRPPAQAARRLSTPMRARKQTKQQASRPDRPSTAPQRRPSPSLRHQTEPFRPRSLRPELQRQIGPSPASRPLPNDCLQARVSWWRCATSCAIADGPCCRWRPSALV